MITPDYVYYYSATAVVAAVAASLKFFAALKNKYN